MPGPAFHPTLPRIGTDLCRARLFTRRYRESVLTFARPAFHPTLARIGTDLCQARLLTGAAIR
ncbi:MAG TPA: hypothetical protein VFD63_18190, partial [Pyrinomonadaceae bacterium]|nr:hypothetical protein [Pyrinomonadaceae bacterium]